MCHNCSCSIFEETWRKLFIYFLHVVHIIIYNIVHKHRFEISNKLDLIRPFYESFMVMENVMRSIQPFIRYETLSVSKHGRDVFKSVNRGADLIAKELIRQMGFGAQKFNSKLDPRVVDGIKL